MSRFAQLQETRSPWEGTWDELASYFLPLRFAGDSGVQPGSAGDELVYDSAQLHALELLVSTLAGQLTSPALPWFGIRIVETDPDEDINEDQEVAEYLSTARDRMLALFNSEITGFASSLYELYTDVALFGVGCFFVEQDDESLVRFSTRTVKEIYLAENKNGVIDTVFRLFTMTARQLAQEFDQSKLPKTVTEALENKPEDRFSVIHAVYPRGDRSPRGEGKLAKDFRFASVYIEHQSRQILEESGYQEMPYMVPRWSKASGEVYGRGPGLTALADTRVLNAMAKTALISAEKMADPPLMVPDDGFLGPVRSGAGGLSYYRAGSADRIEALPINADLAATVSMMEQRRDAIRMVFLADRIQLAEGPDMTATEAQLRQADRMQRLAPVLGRLQAEFLSPLIFRVFNLLLRARALPDPPQTLMGRQWVVQFESPVAAAQRQSQALSMQQVFEFLAPFIGEGDPFGILGNFDMDKMVRKAMSIFGGDPELLKSEKERDQERQAAMQQQQQQRAMEQMQQGAAMAKDLGQTPLGGSEPNALDGLLRDAETQGQPGGMGGEGM